MSDVVAGKRWWWNMVSCATLRADHADHHEMAPGGARCGLLRAVDYSGRLAPAKGGWFLTSLQRGGVV